MSTSSDTDNAVVSTGAGIAIAGAWIAGAAVSITIMMVMFVWSPSDDNVSVNVDAGSFIVLAMIIAAPLFASYSVTKLILGKDF